MPISGQICFRLLISCLSSLSCLIHTCVVVVVHSLIWAAGVSTPPARRPGGWWAKDALGAAGGLQAARLSGPQSCQEAISQRTSTSTSINTRNIDRYASSRHLPSNAQASLRVDARRSPPYALGCSLRSAEMLDSAAWRADSSCTVD